MSHTLTQPEEVEQIWKEMEQGNMTPDLHENNSESVRVVWGRSGGFAYQSVAKPACEGVNLRC